MKGKSSRPWQWWLLCLLVLGMLTGAQVGQTQIAPPLTNLFSFSGGTDGLYPQSGLIQGKDGNFYGTTYGNPNQNDFGTVFKISPSGALTTLHRFTGGVEGADPFASLIQGTDGNFYGTTLYGGSQGLGTVFKISSSGTLITLHSFSGFDVSNPSDSDGANPESSLIQGTDGNFYGTTYNGGFVNEGTVFKISPSGTLTILSTFFGSNGAYPQAGLIQGTDGNFYGTTEDGGTYGYGTVFKINSSGTLTTLHSFVITDGAYPVASLIQGKDGNFYGTTTYGGASNDGTAFKITSSGALTTLHAFSGYPSDGNQPTSLILGKDGYFYGTTGIGGATNDGYELGYGTVFQMSPAGSETMLYSFAGGTDGAYPVASLILGKDGNFYGTTLLGGTGNAGTLFKVTMLPIVHSFFQAQGPAGTAVNLTGNNFTETTHVLVGSHYASFSINSDTSLTVLVPSGAVTSKITVVNPFGKGSNSTPFTVTP